MTAEVTARRWQIRCCMLLCLACGIVDAVGYLRHGIFAANMTGNTVLLGLSLAQLQWDRALDRAMPLLIFLLGAMLSRLLLVRTGNRPWIPLLLGAGLILQALATMPDSKVSLLLITFAMGVQSTAITQFAGVTLSTVVITSTMARIAEALADRLFVAGSAAPSEPAIKAPPPLTLYLLTWGCYLIGALVAGLGDGQPFTMLAAAILIVAAAGATRVA
jgi:uncharacterized membrane protein YoaK (UPF0700 family)